jgi:hypothetical protein
MTDTKTTAKSPATIVANMIAIKRAEGPTALCVRKTFVGPGCWADANAWLRSQSNTYPASGGCDKHDFVVTWNDGDTYEGRLDCKASGCTNNDLDVGRHIVEGLEFLAGTHCPVHMSEEQYRGYLTYNKIECAEYVAYLGEHVIPMGA